MNILSKNLKRFRIAKNMTQEQVAEILGVSTQSVSRWECNTTLPDVTILPKIAALYCVTIDDLYKETSIAYDNYAQRLGSVFEASRTPEDFVRADMEFRKLLKSQEYTTEDLRLYGILYQHMMQVCIERAEKIFNHVIEKGPEENLEVYWSTRRQKGYFLFEIGRNSENIEESLPRVETGIMELQEWICLIQAYLFEEDYDSARRWIKKAENLFPESAILHIYTGDFLRSMKRYEEAFSHWKRALEIEPEWCDASYSMASCFEEMGDYVKAYDIYNQIADHLENKGFDTEAHQTRALALKCKEAHSN